MEEISKMPMKKAARLDPVGSSQPGTSRDALMEMAQDPPRKTSYSQELFNTWRDIRWFQIPLSSLRKPKAGLFSFTFQSSLQRYQQLRKTKRLKVGRPFAMLPLSALPSILHDEYQETLHKQNDSRRYLRARKASVRKSHSSHRKGHQASRKSHIQLQKCRSSTPFLPKRYIFHPRIPQKQGKKPDRCSSQKFREFNLDRDEEDLALEAHSLPHVPPSACHTTEAYGTSDKELKIWDGARCPLENDDRFPPDWTPPRIEFLYDEDPPCLSPAPRPASRSQSWGEMPDITQGSPNLEIEISAKASTPAENVLFLEESIDMQLNEHESGKIGSPDHAMSISCQVVNEEQEGGTFEEQTQTDHDRAFDQEEASPIHPLSIIHSRSSISTVSYEFKKGLTCDSDQEEELGLECSTLSTATSLQLTLSRMSSTCSISASMDELSDDPGGSAQVSDMEQDTDDDGLLSLEELLQTSDKEPRLDESDTRYLSSEQDSYLSSLDKLLDEKREQTQKDEELEGGLGTKVLLSSSLSAMEVDEESEEDGALFPEAHRLFLEKFSINRGTIPTLYPGESIFRFPPHTRTTLPLDATGLEPQNQIERLFFSSQFPRQLALLHDGLISSLYRGQSRCPHAVLRWLFQLITLNPDVSADAFQALWEISTHQIASADKTSTALWCPELKDITQVFCNLGASTTGLYPAGLFHTEFSSKNMELPKNLSGSRARNKGEIIPAKAPSQLILATMLGNIFKFLTLCMASHPDCYPDEQRLSLLKLLCRIGLDQNLRRQPNVEFQQLLLALLEGIQEWPEKLPELCESLCHVSCHHHNLVAVMSAFPDTTARGRQLRRNLSLCFITKLLGKTGMARSHWQEENQLQQLGHLLPLMKPASLKQGLQKKLILPEQQEKGQTKVLAELDLEACYLCYSLLTLANVVVGTKAVPSRQQRHLIHLCNQLQKHISSTIREDSCLMYRVELKNLASQTYIKWQECLSRGWLWTTFPAEPE
ncbi:protein FAM178B [Sceloporus undulatus]|uniref:protein FAM178B n=1 Tax=Sceloporus undulatus TaxID=8520 RepID=UPI001C4C85AA|nr:protein FAM178B [Sceloporus undulatus]